MEEDSDRNYNPATGTCGSQSSGVNIQMHVGSGATVFAPCLSNLQAKDITFSQNNASARHSGGEIDITSVIAEYKKSLVAEHVCIREYTSRPGEHVLLADRYVDPLIIQRHREKKEKKEEIRSKGKDFHHARTYHIDHHITVDKLFSQEDSPNGVPPKAVILQGNSGSGKSFTAQKILYDWANGNLFAGIFDVVFHLRCSELNDIAEDISLVELLNCSEEMAQILKKIPERVLFLVDGFDELRLSLPKKPLRIKADIKAKPGAVLSSLLRGCMLNESFLLVTTRSTAAEKLDKPLKSPQRFTEIMGFSESGIQQYFQKFFESDERSRQVYEEVKANGTLYTACSSPVMCWLICSVFKEKSKMSTGMSESGFRSTTSVFVDFVFILLEHHCQGLTESQELDLLKDLGQLAHKGILKGRVLFQRNQVPETILNVLDSTSIPFLCTFHYKDRINVKEMFSFMHLSFQEFFAALWYTFLDETEAELNLEKLLSDSLQGGYHLLPIIQFLFGLSNKAVSDLLMKKHQHAVSQATCTQLDKWLYEFVSQNTISLDAHLSSFALQCLYEVNDKYMVKNAMKIWETKGVEIQLGSSNTAEFKAAVYCLQFCQRIRCLYLQTSTAENLKMLEKAFSKCDQLRLSLSHVSDDGVADLISAIRRGKDIVALSVEDDNISDQSVELILRTLHRHRSLGSVNLSVKAINYTNVEIVMNILKRNVISRNLSLRASTKCRDSEENLCSYLNLSTDYPLVRKSDEHEKVLHFDMYFDSGKKNPGQTLKSISFIYFAPDCSVMSAFDWRKLFQISSNLKKVENPDLHEHVDALLSFLYRTPDLQLENLYVENLSQKCATKILSFCHASHLHQKFDSLRFQVDSLKGIDEEDNCFLSLSKYTGRDGSEENLSLSLRETWSSPTTQSVESTPAFQEISLGFPVIEGTHVDWEELLRRLCQMRKSLERCPLSSLLPFVPGLEEVTLRLKSLHENWAVKLLSILQACTSLRDLGFMVDSLKDIDEEDICSLSLSKSKANYDSFKTIYHLDLKAHHWSPHTTQTVESTPEFQKISLGFPFIMKGDHVDWEDLLRRLCQMWKSMERCPLSSVLPFVPGLKEVTLHLRSLHENWAVKLLSILQACTSLRYVWLNVDSVKGMGEKDVCSLSLSTHTPPYMETILRLDLEAPDWSRHTTWGVEFTPVLQEISLRFPANTEGAQLDWEDLLSRFCQMWESLERSPLSHVLLSVPGLVEVTLHLRSPHENWAVSILSILKDCTSLQYLEVKVDNGTENLGIVRGNALRDSVFHGKTVLSLGCYHLDYPYDDRMKDQITFDFETSSHEVIPCITFIVTNDSEIYKTNWGRFFYFYYQLKGLTECHLEYDQSLDALMSVVNSIPGLKEMHLALRFLTVDGAFSIVQLMQTCPSLHKIDVTVAGQTTRNVTNNSFPLDSESDNETNSISSDHSDSSRLTNSGGDTDSDRLSFPTYTRVAEEIEHYELDLCSEQKVWKNSRNEFKLSLRCNSSDPDTKAVLAYISLILTEYTEESEIDWRSFFQSYYNSKGLTERSPDFDGKVNNILRFLHDVPGLKEVEMGVHSLTETWASHILLLSHENNSIDNICLLLEKENDQDSACSSVAVKRNHKDSTVTVKISSVNYTEASPSLISFTVPYSEILSVDRPDLLSRMRCLRFENDKSYNYEEEINQLMSFLHGIPGLQKLKLEIGNLTECWATRILSFRTCPSLKKICVTTLHRHMIMEDAILKIKKKWRRRDCVVVLKGLRCSNSTARCTEENWTPHTYLECNGMVKLSLCGGFCSQLDGFYKTDSESEADTYDYKFDLNEDQPDAQEPEWAEEEFTEDHDIFEF
ncbi:hypothetical protein AOLI_G00213850 [Acnodon oligacanthus]